MFKKNIPSIILLLSLFLAACGENANVAPEASTPVAAITSTPDLCSAENLPAEVAKVNKLMREFDDFSVLAASTPQAQLIQIIPDLQRVLRDAEDQAVPACLSNLKKLQLDHMNVVVQTLIAFMSASDQAGVDIVSEGITKARSLHDQYNVEIARLLGVTLEAPPTVAPTAIAPTATP
jgi:hypothetical protein